MKMSSAPNTVSKIRFYEFGQKAPVDSRYKGTMDQAALVGLYNYTGRDGAANEKSESPKEKNTTARADGFFGYTSAKTKKASADGSASPTTFTNIGWLTPEKEKVWLQDLKKAYSEKGNLFWSDIVSLRDFMQAEKCSMFTVDDYAAVVDKVLPQFFNYVGLDPKNMIWWMNYHNDTDNPHFHLQFLEKKQTRTRGKFTNKQAGKLKVLFSKEFGAREVLKERVGMDSSEYFKKKDQEKIEIIKLIKEQKFDSTKLSLDSFYKKLPSRGRLQYNSIQIAPYRKELDAIITSLLQQPSIKPTYNQWLHTVDTLADTMNQINHDDIATIKDAEIKKLYAHIGNTILKGAKKQQLFEDEFQKNKTGGSDKQPSFRSGRQHRFVKNMSMHQLKRSTNSYLRQREREIEEEIQLFLKQNHVSRTY